ncbi:glycoside hydrolase family 3 N-terminal domain-containing protein [Neobacillus cucumis]|uniref:glycoside hydrolase family 3 N-terminal domain-containing protein n=1 Tax=Neobacillus cucumis TaxID=1740721 RepID=UPI0019633B47|nr:glycoside hydrolase family 3 N-terminal domain-containing protein [Neobacillus cucumis]MBM7650960.1 beta-glucosidase [Neobacillus cucumis]
MKKIKKIGQTSLVLALSAAMLFSGPMMKKTVYASSGNLETPATKAAASKVAKQIEDEGIVLLKNVKNTLPLKAPNKKGIKVNVFGTGTIDPFYGGGGSGAIKSDNIVSFYNSLDAAGISYNSNLHEKYNNWYAEHKTDGTSSGEGGATGMFLSSAAHAEMPMTEISGSDWQSYQDYSDTAVVMISRSGSEGSDLKKNDLKLQQNEAAMLSKVTANFKNVIVLLNISNTLEMGWLSQDETLTYSNSNGIQTITTALGDSSKTSTTNAPAYFIDSSKITSAAIIWSPGEVGMKSVGEVLTGAVNPSGKLADTVAYDVESAPSYQNFGDYAYADNANSARKYFHVDYKEGIYVGYRYYETFGKQKEVQYPFGYGLSYTNFSQHVVSFDQNHDTITLQVKVRNTGNTAGKDVVEVYYSAPWKAGQVEKSSIDLAAYAKTKELQPGEAQTLTIQYATTDMASYDKNEGDGAYVMDTGKYEIMIGSDVEHTTSVGSYNLAKKRVLDKDNKTGTTIKNLFQNDTTYKGMTTLSRASTKATYPASPSGNETLADYGVDPSTIHTLPTTTSDKTNAAKQGVSYDKVITLQDVYKDHSLWDKFLDQLTLDEMIDLIANDGYQTAGLDKYGIIATTDNDGPAAVKGTNGFNYTDSGVAWPVETAVASTWNTNLAKDMGVAVGQEAKDLGTQVWYAPAMNTHRSPMGGRNFEYYSEDPVIAGNTGAAVVAGAKSKGLVVTIKHFVANDQETHRDDNGVFTWVDEQALREVYLKPFEISIKEGGAMGIMSSFNSLGQTWAGASKPLLTDLARKEWGFNGFVVTDFFQYTWKTNTNYMSPVLAVYAGNDAMLSGVYAWQKPDVIATMTAQYNQDPVNFGNAMRTAVKNICTMKMSTSKFTDSLTK